MSGEIEAISSREGLEYFEKISFNEYYTEIEKSIQKGKEFIYSIYNEDILVGFLLFSDRKNNRNVVVYSQVDTWNVDFLNNLSDALRKIPSSSGKISMLRYRLSISKIERMKNLNQTDFEKDTSKNKILMIKKIKSD